MTVLYSNYDDILLEVLIKQHACLTTGTYHAVFEDAVHDWREELDDDGRARAVPTVLPTKRQANVRHM